MRILCVDRNDSVRAPMFAAKLNQAYRDRLRAQSAGYLSTAKGSALHQMWEHLGTQAGVPQISGHQGRRLSDVCMSDFAIIFCLNRKAYQIVSKDRSSHGCFVLWCEIDQTSSSGTVSEFEGCYEQISSAVKSLSI